MITFDHVTNVVLKCSVYRASSNEPSLMFICNFIQRWSVREGYFFQDHMHCKQCEPTQQCRAWSILLTFTCFSISFIYSNVFKFVKNVHVLCKLCQILSSDIVSKKNVSCVVDISDISPNPMPKRSSSSKPSRFKIQDSKHFIPPYTYAWYWHYMK